MANQEFKVTFKVTTECEEQVDSMKILQWIRDQFDGADLGRVTGINVVEKPPKKQWKPYRQL